MELWDVFTADREKTGKTAVRGEALGAGKYHVVVHIWLVNDEGNLLIQKRAACVEWAPNIWATTGGSALAGEDSAAACARELLEETGIRADMESAELAFALKREDSFCDVWLIRQNADLDRCKMQAEEVSAVKWASPEEIRSMAAKGVFWSYRYLDDLFSLIRRPRAQRPRLTW